MEGLRLKRGGDNPCLTERPPPPTTKGELLSTLEGGKEKVGFRRH